MFSALTYSAVIAQIVPWLEAIAVPLGVIIGIGVCLWVAGAILHAVGIGGGYSGEPIGGHTDAGQAQSMANATGSSVSMRSGRIVKPEKAKGSAASNYDLFGPGNAARENARLFDTFMADLEGSSKKDDGGG